MVNSLDSLPCPVNCSLTCTLTYQPQVCTALALPGCREDGDVVFSISSNLSHHDTQPEPGVLYLPVDRVEAAGERTEAPLVCPHRTSLDCQASCQLPPDLLTDLIKADVDIHFAENYDEVYKIAFSED